MNIAPNYHFHRTKYGEELLIDVVALKDIKKYLSGETLHTLSYFDITLITEGEGLFKIADKTYQVQKGDVLFTLPNQLREWDTTNIINGYALIFEEEFLLSFFSDPDFLNHISFFNRTELYSSRLMLSDDEFCQVELLIQQVKNEIFLYNKKDKHILRAILYQILKHLDRIFIQKNNNNCQKNAQNQYIRKYIEYVNLNFRLYHAVQYYADMLCLTPNYLNELVKKETGITAKEVINNKILSESKQLLLYTSKPVSEIADILNFETPSYFVRFFRKHSNQTPLQYRKTNKP